MCVRKLNLRTELLKQSKHRFYWTFQQSQFLFAIEFIYLATIESADRNNWSELLDQKTAKTIRSHPSFKWTENKHEREFKIKYIYIPSFRSPTIGSRFQICLNSLRFKKTRLPCYWHLFSHFCKKTISHTALTKYTFFGCCSEQKNRRRWRKA